MAPPQTGRRNTPGEPRVRNAGREHGVIEHGVIEHGAIENGVIERARRHAALGDPIRLAIVEELRRSDRTPTELGERFGLASNLLNHHLGTLSEAGLIERLRSAGDARRRYVRLRPEALDMISDRQSAETARPGTGAESIAAPRALFVCTHNSARSQLAAALWRFRLGAPATSAGTEPSEGVHPGAVAAAQRLGLDLSSAIPRWIGPDELAAAPLVITVCDRAHEEVDLPPNALHWSIPDPVGSTDPEAFDRAAEMIDGRIIDLQPMFDDQPRPPATRH